MNSARLALLAAALLCAAPGPAAADWYVTPFIGVSSASQTTVGATDRNNATWGASLALLSSGLFGIEADFGHTPGFFERDASSLTIQSSAVTLGGNVIIAAPLSLTRESLRPYFVGGVTWLNAASVDVLGLFPVERKSAATVFGGGIIGMLSDRTGVRLDVRRISDVSGGEPEGFSSQSPELSFWRTSFGVTLRY